MANTYISWKISVDCLKRVPLADVYFKAAWRNASRPAYMYLSAASLSLTYTRDLLTVPPSYCLLDI